MSEATPRITAKHLETFAGRTVRIIGKVLQLHGESATIDAGGQVSLILSRDSHLAIGHAFEIIGRINNDLSIRVLSSRDFGTDLDFAAVEAVVAATHAEDTRRLYYNRD